MIKIWDLNTGLELWAIASHTGGVTSVAISPDSRRIVSGGNDKLVKVWDLKTGKNVHTFTGHLEPILSVAISPNGQLIASGCRNDLIRIRRMP
jgi:FOG: WD40 repeat